MSVQRCSPHTGEPLFDVSESGDAAMAAARAAQPEWAALGVQARGAKLAEAASRIEADAEALVALIISDVGKPEGEARGEVARAAAILRYAAGQAFQPVGEVYADAAGEQIRVLRFPRGVALLITPWNFPIAIPVWKAAPALLTGNAVVLKPAPAATRVAERLAEYLPIHLATGDRETAEALLDAGPDVVSFTGSTATGRSIAQRIPLIPLQLEMGGKNAVYVSEHADAATAARIALGGAMGYAGQKCTATSLLYVHEAAHTAVMTQLAAQLPEDVGPMIEAAKRDDVVGRLQNVLAGGKATGYAAMQPTLVAPSELDAVELFAPVLSVRSVAGMDEALERLDGIEYGLVSGIVSPIRDEVETWARRADTGLVRVNAPTAGLEPHVPFGGSRASSLGPREQGRAGVEFFTETRTVYG